MNQEFRKLAGKAGTVEILEALNGAPGGLSYKTIEFDVVGRSSAYTALNAVKRHDLVELVGSTYRITRLGKNYLKLVRGMDKLHSHLPAGVRRN